MTNENEETNIKKMAVLLRQGATMLDLSCPQCSNILFRLKNGKINCPSCNKEVIIQKRNFSSALEQNIDKSLHNQSTSIKNKNFSKEIILLQKKIKILCRDLEQIKEINLLDLQLKVLERLVNIYQSLVNLNKFGDKYDIN